MISFLCGPVFVCFFFRPCFWSRKTEFSHFPEIHSEITCCILSGVAVVVCFCCCFCFCSCFYVPLVVCQAGFRWSPFVYVWYSSHVCLCHCYCFGYCSYWHFVCYYLLCLCCCCCCWHCFFWFVLLWLNHIYIYIYIHTCVRLSLLFSKMCLLLLLIGWFSPF